MVIPPHISLFSNMHLLITKKGTMVKHVVDALNFELYEHNIREG